MARISTYPLDTNLVRSDYWIGSDANSNYATKNFSIGSVIDYINNTGVESQTLRYKYTNTVPLQPGSISFQPQGADNVNFSDITGMRLSSQELTEGGDISSYYSTPLVGSSVLITQTDDVARYGVFKWDSATVVPGNTDFYDIGLTFNQGSNGLITGKDYFISLLVFPGQEDANKVMSVPPTPGAISNSYVLQHGLNKFCSVTVVDASDVLVMCNVTWLSVNSVRVNFENNFTGKVFFN
jgi:hypothetical protein